MAAPDRRPCFRDRCLFEDVLKGPAGIEAGLNVGFAGSMKTGNASVFNGEYSRVSIGAAFGGGYTYSAASMGQAGSSWSGTGQAGFDLYGARSFKGNSQVMSSRKEKCGCERSSSNVKTADHHLNFCVIRCIWHCSPECATSRILAEHALSFVGKFRATKCFLLYGYLVDGRW